ncbi:MAG TPA: SDR family oxidoreductase [Allosphingosinicella sp.]|nr:SDR family oxidoreductase [Allosphingosinicella sp.]
MHVLVTGAAGLIGSEVTALLAAAGHSVTGLVRSNLQLVRNDRTPIKTSGWRGSPPPAGKVAIVAGDVSLPDLGLGASAYERLASSLDLIVHCAAVTQFAAPPELHARVNVAGTANVLALARSGRPHGIPLVHVSTAYVCGDSEGPVAEDMPIRSDGFANGYEASKASGERLVEQARREGMAIAVARPSIVMGDSRTGSIQNFCDVYRFIRLVAEGSIRSLAVAPHATLDLVPVDYVSAAIVAISERMDEARGKNFHLVSGRPVPVGQFTAAIGAYPGLASVALVEPRDFRLADIPRPEQRYQVAVAQLYGRYLQCNPVFSQDNLRRLTGAGCPLVDQAYFKRLLDYAVEQGFIRPANGRLEQAA